jgi:arylformamidase
MFVEFSYLISEETNAAESSIYSPKVTPRSRLSAGARSNTSYFELFAHNGTHIDSPWHIIPDGWKINDFEIKDFIFEKVLQLNLRKGPDEEVTVNDLNPWKDQLGELDALLINTGFSDCRTTDVNKFLTHTPGLSTDLAQWLAGFTNIRCFGVDFSSIENIPRARLSGYPVHHILLGREQPTILLEDANLRVLEGMDIKRVYLFPMRISGLEASPVTAVAEL